MSVHVLASGSKGNAIFMNLGETKILVDAGISARRIQKGLAELGVAVEDLDAIFITHEHRDHVSGLPTLTKKYHLPVYAKHSTWGALYCKEQIPDRCKIELEDSMDIRQVKVEPFLLSHDAVEPVGYNLYYHDTKYSVATDLGFVTPTVRDALSLTDILVLESNHDYDMLKSGSYPWSLKRRIMSNKGHLSNQDAGWTLARLDRKNKTRVLLAHLSQENNKPELAESTVSAILKEQGCRVGEDVLLKLTSPDKTVSWEE